MFVGHALLAFALAGLVADWRGWSGRRALAVGALAGAFAAVPDVDVVYAVAALDPGGVDGALEASTAFWGASTEVHRSITHSLVVAGAVGSAMGLWVAGTATVDGRLATPQLAGAGVLVALVIAAVLASGLLGGVVMGAFVAACAALGTVARRHATFSPRTVALAAAFGLFSHPWGDLFTGEPPYLLYPLDYRLLDGRIVLHGDPTLHLLGAFAIELCVIWLAAAVYVRLTDRSLRRLVGRRAAIGGVYGAAAVVLTPPTLAVSYHFVFSIVAVGLLCGVTPTRPLPVPEGRPRLSRPDPDAAVRVALTSVAGVTVALVVYAFVYVSVVAP